MAQVNDRKVGLAREWLALASPVSIA